MDRRGSLLPNRRSLFPLKRFQRRFVARVLGPGIRRAVLCLPRGNGKSWLAGYLAAESLRPGGALFRAGDENVLLSGSFDQARYCYRFAKGLLGEAGYAYQNNKQQMGIHHLASGTRLLVKSSRARGAFGIVGARIAIADEPGAWDAVGGELMADALDTALGKPGSDLVVVYIGTLAPAMARWWPMLVRGGSHGSTYVQAIEGDPARWDRWPEIRRCNPLMAAFAESRATLLEERRSIAVGAGRRRDATGARRFDPRGLCRAHQSVRVGRARRGQNRSARGVCGVGLSVASATPIRVFRRRCSDQRQSSVFAIGRTRFAIELARPAGRGECAPMKWPWQQSAPVEHRSSYTDAVVSAILKSATGGGVRPALATAALEACASMYASALAACEVSGPSVVTRALDASWRAATASELIRRGQAVYIVGADPVDGLELRPATSFELYGGADPPWVYRIERAGPSNTRWHTYGGGSILHLRWQVDHGRPWLGVSPLQHASDTANLAGWLERRLGEEASAPVGSFLPVARYDADPDADLDDADADDPLAALRSDIGRARGQVLAVESQIAQADSPASAPRRDYQTLRFGANPPDGLIQLRDKVAADVGAACGVPRGLLVSSGSAQAAREAWRQFIATSVDGLCRRLEAQILTQLGVEVAIDSAPLGGRDLAARASAYARLIKGGLSVGDARTAAGI